MHKGHVTKVRVNRFGGIYSEICEKGIHSSLDAQTFSFLWAAFDFDDTRREFAMDEQ